MGQVTASILVAGFVAFLVIVILKKTAPSYGGARTWANFANYGAPEGTANWIGPALVLAAWAEVGAPEMRNATATTWLVVSAFAGLLAVAMSRPGLRTLRDIFLSLCAIPLTIILMIEYLGGDGGEGQGSLLNGAMILLFSSCLSLVH